MYAFHTLAYKSFGRTSVTLSANTYTSIMCNTTRVCAILPECVQCTLDYPAEWFLHAVTSQHAACTVYKVYYAITSCRYVILCMVSPSYMYRGSSSFEIVYLVFVNEGLVSTCAVV